MDITELARRAAPFVDSEDVELCDRAASVDRAHDRRLVEVLPGLSLLRERRRTAFESMLYEPTFCLILRGRKLTTVGEHTYASRAGQCLVISHDIAVVARVVEAPYMSLLLRLDIGLLRSLADDVAAAGLDTKQAGAMIVNTAEPALIDALARVVALSSSPQAKVLGPLIVKEIHYRLLMAPFGGMLRRMALHDPSASAVARAIAIIRRDYKADLAIPALARSVGMSASSFHRHFKAVTSSTPLQYQKDLRLLEARRLIAAGAAVTAAAFEVGYESPSQFTREYGRKFGVAPSRDLVGVAA